MRRMHLLSIVYVSTATIPFSSDELSELLNRSRRNNLLTDLTGVLLHREGRFLQVLEGPEDLIRGRMALISADPRHSDVEVLLEETIEQRRFPQWSMRHEHAISEGPNRIPGFRRIFETTHDDVSVERIAAIKSLLGWFQERAQA